LLLPFFAALVILISIILSSTLQRLILKPNRSIGEIRPLLLTLALICGLLSIIFSILFAAGAFDPHRPPMHQKTADFPAMAAGILAILLIVFVYWWFDRRSKIILQKWAYENGFQIMEKKKRYLFFAGPFNWWTNSRNQIIYYLKVRDRNGRERSGWARCGSYFGGVFFSDKIEVKWDEP
jgi:hypothetical protein